MSKLMPLYSQFFIQFVRAKTYRLILFIQNDLILIGTGHLIG